MYCIDIQEIESWDIINLEILEPENNKNLVFYMLLRESSKKISSSLTLNYIENEYE